MVKAPLAVAGISCALAVLGVGCVAHAPSQEQTGQQSLRLYVIDGGVLHVPDPARFQLRKEDVRATDLSVGCYLVTHPKGTLFWDACAVPDAEWTPTGGPVAHHLTLPDSQQRDITMTAPLKAQLASVGFAPSDMTYLALSHYHYDHTANADMFAASTWLVRQVERDAMFADRPPDVTRPTTYGGLRASKAILIGLTTTTSSATAPSSSSRLPGIRPDIRCCT